MATAQIDMQAAIQAARRLQIAQAIQNRVKESRQRILGHVHSAEEHLIEPHEMEALVDQELTMLLQIGERLLQLGGADNGH